MVGECMYHPKLSQRVHVESRTEARVSDPEKDPRTHNWIVRALIKNSLTPTPRTFQTCPLSSTPLMASPSSFLVVFLTHTTK
ncbi:uncharacterized protein G2W53_018722 [Senna tora]|uniref:Uncharacterized protein n=1 Tax=Senna tora TaxID=362788 RepID=A0A834TSX9_9FABA|nr:uncharacterized protein G2W53_018722 [Senna tora]